MYWFRTYFMSSPMLGIVKSAGIYVTWDPCSIHHRHCQGHRPRPCVTKCVSGSLNMLFRWMLANPLHGRYFPILQIGKLMFQEMKKVAHSQLSVAEERRKATCDHTALSRYHAECLCLSVWMCMVLWKHELLDSGQLQGLLGHLFDHFHPIVQLTEIQIRWSESQTVLMAQIINTTILNVKPKILYFNIYKFY